MQDANILADYAKEEEEEGGRKSVLAGHEACCLGGGASSFYASVSAPGLHISSPTLTWQQIIHRNKT